MLDYVRDLRRRPIPVRTAHRRFRTVRALARHMAPRSLLEASADDLAEWAASRRLDPRAATLQRSDIADFYEWCRSRADRGEGPALPGPGAVPPQDLDEPRAAAAVATAAPPTAGLARPEAAPRLPAPPRRQGRSVAQRVAVAVVLLAVSALWIASAVLPDRSTEPGETTTSTARTRPRPTTTVPPPTTAPLRPPAEVSVLAVNASGVTGRAARATERVRAAGYTTVAPEAGPTRQPTSAVYWAPGYENEARAVAAAVGLPPQSVTGPRPDRPIVPEAGSANVVVVVGQDLAG